MRRWLTAVAALATVGCFQPPPDAETVVLVHGLGRTWASMSLLGSRLEYAGYNVVNVGYPSRTAELEELVDTLAVSVDDCCSELDRFHFVTHSMGGVLVRSYLAREDVDFDGHVVMIAPPNEGSELIDAFADTPLLRRVVGPAGLRLGTDSASVLAELPPVDFSLGIIAGNQSMNPLGSWLVPGRDDGKVSVERAMAPGASDFILVPASHTFIMNRADVAKEIDHFITDGAFLSREPVLDRR